MIRVALIDDHSLVRAGLKNLIANLPDFEVVAEGADGSDLEQVLAHGQPDILLLDISMRSKNGLDVLQALHPQKRKLKVLILSMHMEPEYVMQALNLGANGYLLKEAAPQELKLALEAMTRNESYLSPGIAAMVIRKATEDPRLSKTLNIPSVLTPRQNEVLRLLARGCSTRDMAQGLKVSIKTVETHRAQIMERLNLRDVPSLVRYAIRSGLVRLDE